jgi:hypothetical protein
MRGRTGEQVRLAHCPKMEAGYGQVGAARLARYGAIVFNIVTLSLPLEPTARQRAILLGAARTLWWMKRALTVYSGAS